MKQKILVLVTFLLVGITTALGQTITVKGTVVDEKGQPATGATVRVKSDAKRGSFTNMDGAFTLKAKEGEILIVSFVGYITQELPATAKMKIQLKPNQEVLDEFVVIGYGSGQKISSTTASVVKVNAKDLESKPTANVFDGIQGKVSGLSVFSASGEPGQGVSIKLHGNGSLGLGSAPLYILDGVPVGSGTIMGMNPNDFESMQVLKDAAATAIYGSRASNGVIFLTTKRGKAGDRAKITLTTQYGLSSLANRDYYDSFLSSQELADFWVESGIKTKEYVDQFVKANPHNTNWTDFMYSSSAPTYSASLSISGGKGSTNYFMSGQHFYQEGLMANSKYTKSNFRINLNTKVNDWLRISSSNSVYYDNTLSANTSSNSSRSKGLFYLNLPMYSPYKEDGTPYWDEQIPGANFYNPRYVAAMTPAKSSTFEYFGTMSATIRPVKGLTLMSRVGLDFSNYHYDGQRSPLYVGSPGNGYRGQSFSKGVEWTFTNTAEYRFNAWNDHEFTFLLGHEYNQYDGESFSASGSGLKDYRLMHLDQVLEPEKRSIDSSLSQNAYLSFFGRFSYGYLDRYFLDLTLRNDASSKFPEAHRNAAFWSVGTKWNAQKEDFLRDVKWLNKLDVKASIGTSGNSALGNYQFWAIAATSDPYNGEASTVISTPGNPDLTWETQRKTTIGFDIRMFDKVGINLEFYDRLTTSMVMSVPYPYTTGITSNVKNVGDYLNRGVDLRFDYDVWNDRKGNYVQLYGNFNYNYDKVLKLFQGLDSWPLPGSNLLYRVGLPVMMYMPIFKQVNPETGDPEWYVPGDDISVTQKDDSKFVSGNNFNKEALQQNTGIRRNPPFGGGFGLYATYAGFYMQADFTFYLGKHMISNDLYFSENSTKFKNFNVGHSALDYWKKPGDHVHLPDIKRYGTLIQFDTRMLQDASFMRLKNFTVGYQVPRNILKKQDFFTAAKISLTGRNILTWTGFEGPDPEPDTNLTYGRNPSTKQYTIGLELTF